jgi:CPA1 family monovalent cation:H+ antiporter
MSEKCQHFPESPIETTNVERCSECEISTSLRMCITCGKIGCCESGNSHGRQHAKEMNHPIIKSYPVSDGHFTWCYDCNKYL